MMRKNWIFIFLIFALGKVTQADSCKIWKKPSPLIYRASVFQSDCWEIRSNEETATRLLLEECVKRAAIYGQSGSWRVEHSNWDWSGAFEKSFSVTTTITSKAEDNRQFADRGNSTPSNGTCWNRRTNSSEWTAGSAACIQALKIDLQEQLNLAFEDEEKTANPYAREVLVYEPRFGGVYQSRAETVEIRLEAKIASPIRAGDRVFAGSGTESFRR